MIGGKHGKQYWEIWLIHKCPIFYKPYEYKILKLFDKSGNEIKINDEIEEY